MYIHTTSHTVPLNEKQLHKRLGLITQPHPDIKDSIELFVFGFQETIPFRCIL